MVFDSADCCFAMGRHPVDEEGVSGDGKSGSFRREEPVGSFRVGQVSPGLRDGSETVSIDDLVVTGRFLRRGFLEPDGSSASGRVGGEVAEVAGRVPAKESVTIRFDLHLILVLGQGSYG